MKLIMFIGGPPNLADCGQTSWLQPITGNFYIFSSTKSNKILFFSFSKFTNKPLFKENKSVKNEYNCLKN